MAFAIMSMSAQKSGPVIWNVALTDNSPHNATITFSAKIESGWHLYGLQLPDDGPNATSISFDLPEGVELNGPLTASRPAAEKFDAIFSLNLPRWENEVVFTQHLSVTSSGTHNVSGIIRYQACNGQTCVAPQKVPFNIAVGVSTESQPTENADAETTAVVSKKKTVKTDEPAQTDDADVTSGETSDHHDYRLLFYAALAGGTVGGFIASFFAMLWFSGYTRRIFNKILNHQQKK